MKKLMIFLLVLVSPYLFYLFLRFVNCRVDNSVYEVSRPFAEAVLKHVEKYGRPKDLKEVENLPYKLKPCAEKPKEFGCRDYFFVKDGKYYTAYLTGSPPNGVNIWMNLDIEYNYTDITYSIWHRGKVIQVSEYKPDIARRSVGICENLRF